MLLVFKILLTVLVIWISVVLFRVIRFFQYRRYRLHHIHKLPGKRWHNQLGVVSEFENTGESGLWFMREMVRIYPRLSYWYFGPATVAIMVCHPDTVKSILKTSEPKTVEYGFYEFLLPWLGDGLLTSGGKKWARHRRLLTPAFHFDILKPYNGVNNQSAQTLLDKIDAVASKGEYFEVFSSISLCTLEVMLRCALSYPDEIQTAGDSHPYVKAVNTLGATLMFRAFNPIVYLPSLFWPSKAGRKFRKSCNFVHGVASDIIQRRKKTLKLDDNRRSKRMLDFLDILLTARDEGGKGLTDREIRDEVDTFLFEGHDTTSSGISWMLYSMAQNPDWQRQCQDEIDTIMNGRDSDDILWDDLPKFRVLTACLKEALRVHSPVPIIERETTRDMYLDGYFIPAGTAIDINIYGLMHNQLVWEQAMVYKPERFLEEGEAKDSFAFIPFSAGPRNCIGQNFAMHEMKTIVARILRRFTLETDPSRPAKHKLSLVMRTESGMYLRAIARNIQHQTVECT